MSRPSLPFHRRNWLANRRLTDPYLVVGILIAGVSAQVTAWGVMLLAVLWVLWVTGVWLGWIR